MDSLPSEMIIHLSSYLDKVSLILLSLTCKYLSDSLPKICLTKQEFGNEVVRCQYIGILEKVFHAFSEKFWHVGTIDHRAPQVREWLSSHAVCKEYWECSIICIEEGDVEGLRYYSQLGPIGFSEKYYLLDLAIQHLNLDMVNALYEVLKIESKGSSVRSILSDTYGKSKGFPQQDFLIFLVQNWDNIYDAEECGEDLLKIYRRSLKPCATNNPQARIFLLKHGLLQ